MNTLLYCSPFLTALLCFYFLKDTTLQSLQKQIVNLTTAPCTPFWLVEKSKAWQIAYPLLTLLSYEWIISVWGKCLENDQLVCMSCWMDQNLFGKTAKDQSNKVLLKRDKNWHKMVRNLPAALELRWPGLIMPNSTTWLEGNSTRYGIV